MFLYDLYNLYIFSKGKHSVDEWYNTLLELVDNTFSETTDSAYALNSLRMTLEEMITSYRNYTVDKADLQVGLDFIIEYLKNNFKDTLHSYRFLDGNLTFCEMIPMRSIPFKVICIIGLNNNTFPRKRKPLSFDLMALHPKRGDRNLRDNDKYLFLETIISAKEKLYLSYVGQDIVLNSDIQPSVLISQFIYYLKSRIKIETSKDIEKDIISKHKIFSFNPAYFVRDGDQSFISYIEEDFNAAKILTHRGESEDIKFVDAKINKEPEDNIISIIDLLNFFTNPVKHYFKKTLNINFDEKTFAIDDEEPVDLNDLDAFTTKNKLLDDYFKNRKLKRYIFKYTGFLPPGGAGMGDFYDIARDVQDFLNDFLIKKYSIIRDRKTHEIRFKYVNDDGGEYVVEGVLDYFHSLNIPEEKKPVIKDLDGYNLVNYRLANTKAQKSEIPVKEIVKSYIKHLILNYYEFANGAEKLSHSFLFGEEKEKGKVKYKTYEFKGVTDVEETFKYIVNLYLSGLKEPLHFHPSKSYEYYAKKDKFNASTAFKFLKEGSYNSPPDSYISFYLKDIQKESDFFNDPFKEISKKLFGFIYGALEGTDNG